jgi:ankyrin repeat protein
MLFINCATKQQMSTLIEATLKGDHKPVQDLLDKNTDINAKDTDGRTALMYASSMVKSKLLKY